MAPVAALWVVVCPHAAAARPIEAIVRIEMNFFI
jgi:hypothetical protein